MLDAEMVERDVNNPMLMQIKQDLEEDSSTHPKFSTHQGTWRYNNRLILTPTSENELLDSMRG